MSVEVRLDKVRLTKVGAIAENEKEQFRYEGVENTASSNWKVLKLNFKMFKFKIIKMQEIKKY